MGCRATKPEKKQVIIESFKKEIPLESGTPSNGQAPGDASPNRRRFAPELTATSFSDIRRIYKFDPKVIGNGHFGTVRIAWLASNPSTRFAVKTISKEKIKKDIHILRRELEILKSLSHPNIIKFYETYQDERFFHLVMELCTGGELLDRVIHDGQLRESEAARVMKKIFSAVAYLHLRGICHRDLKPENFLFSDSSREAEIKIIDFGLSRKFGQDDTKMMRTVVGTALYVAPEVLRGNYDIRCDYWSLGVILYILLSGSPPFYAEANHEIFKLVLAGKFSLEGPEWRRVSRHAKDLISKLLVLDPAKRMTAAEAMNHPWFEQHGNGRPRSDSSPDIDRKVIERLRAYSFAGRFKKEALRVVSAMMSEGDLKQLNEAFRAMDKDGTGLIHVYELEEAMRSCGYEETQAEIRRIVEEMNYGESQQINYTDFIAAMFDQRKFLTKEKIWAVFKHFDTDNTDYITKENLKEAMARMGRKLSEDVLEEMMKMLDLNNDGKIYYEDFFRMMTSDQVEHINRPEGGEFSFLTKLGSISDTKGKPSNDINPSEYAVEHYRVNGEESQNGVKKVN